MFAGALRLEPSARRPTIHWRTPVRAGFPSGRIAVGLGPEMSGLPLVFAPMSVRQGLRLKKSEVVVLTLVFASCAVFILQRKQFSAYHLVRELENAGDGRELAFISAQIASLGPAAESSIAKLLHHTRQDLRVAGTLLISRIDTPTARDLLLSQLADGDIEVRTTAAVQIGLRCGERVLPRLQVLVEKGDVQQACAAVVAMERSQHLAALSTLISAARHSNVEVRAQAIESLGRRRDQQALAVVLESLGDPTPVRSPLLGEFRDSLFTERIGGADGLVVGEAPDEALILSDVALKAAQRISGKLCDGFQSVSGEELEKLRQCLSATPTTGASATSGPAA